MGEIVDLHIHTVVSDGTLTPKEVIDVAKKNNVSTIAIADHDTIEAYTKDFFEYASKRNINIIKAVEISTKSKKCGVHVLGYNIDINNNELKDELFKLRNARHIYLHDVSEKLRELGFRINENELDKIEAVTKAHIALDIIENSKNEELLIKKFGHIPGKGEFIETIMNEGCPAYVKKATISPKEAGELIRKAGGKVVLAHPVAYQYEDGLNEEDILELIKQTKADGVETNYIYIDRNNNKINEVSKWSEFAKKYNLKETVGSDFHNDDGIRPVIGLIGEDIKIDSKNILNFLIS